MPTAKRNRRFGAGGAGPGCGQYDAVATTDPTPHHFSSTIELQDCNLKYRSQGAGVRTGRRRAVGRRIEAVLFCGFSRTMHSARPVGSAFTPFCINLRDLLPWRSIATKSPTETDRQTIAHNY